MITRLDCIVYVPSGAPLRDQHNDPADDDNDLNCDLEMHADEMRDYEDQDPDIPPTSFEALLLPTPGPSPPGISIHAAIKVSYIH